MKPISMSEPNIYRVYRGGSWYYDPSFARVAYRSWYAPDSRSSLLGFRLAWSVQ